MLGGCLFWGDLADMPKNWNLTFSGGNRMWIWDENRQLVCSPGGSPPPLCREPVKLRVLQILCFCFMSTWIYRNWRFLFLNVTLEGVCWKQTKRNNLTFSWPKNTHSQWGDFFFFFFLTRMCCKNVFVHLAWKKKSFNVVKCQGNKKYMH